MLRDSVGGNWFLICEKLLEIASGLGLGGCVQSPLSLGLYLAYTCAAPTPTHAATVSVCS